MQLQLLTDLRKKPFESIVEKRENADYQFPTMFSIIFKESFLLPVTFILLSQNAFNLDKLEILSLDNTLPNKKTLWEKKKSLVMNNFSFSHIVFNPLENIVPFT